MWMFLHIENLSEVGGVCVFGLVKYFLVYD